MYLALCRVNIANFWYLYRLLKACGLAGEGYNMLCKAVAERFNIVPTNDHWALYEIIHKKGLIYATKNNMQ